MIVTFDGGSPRPTRRSPRASLTVRTAVAKRVAARSCSRRRRVAERGRPPVEPAPEELGHRLVQVEDHRHARQPHRQRREDEEVRQGVDLHQAVAPSSVGGGQREPGTRTRKARYSRMYVPSPAPWWRCTPRRCTWTPSSTSAAGSPGRRSANTSTGRPGRGDRLGLAPDPGILLVVGVRQHRDRTRIRGVRDGCHTRRERTPTARSARGTLRAP